RFVPGPPAADAALRSEVRLAAGLRLHRHTALAHRAGRLRHPSPARRPRRPRRRPPRRIASGLHFVGTAFGGRRTISAGPPTHFVGDNSRLLPLVAQPILAVRTYLSRIVNSRFARVISTFSSGLFSFRMKSRANCRYNLRPRLKMGKLIIAV